MGDLLRSLEERNSDIQAWSEQEQRLKGDSTSLGFVSGMSATVVMDVEPNDVAPLRRIGDSLDYETKEAFRTGYGDIAKGNSGLGFVASFSEILEPGLQLLHFQGLRSCTYHRRISRPDQLSEDGRQADLLQNQTSLRISGRSLKSYQTTYRIGRISNLGLGTRRGFLGLMEYLS